MRVYERNLSESTHSATNRMDEAQRIQTQVFGDHAASPRGDRVALSGLTDRISQGMQALSARSAQRVSQLQKDFQNGRYQPDASKISQVLTMGSIGEAVG